MEAMEILEDLRLWDLEEKLGIGFDIVELSLRAISLLV